MATLVEKEVLLEMAANVSANLARNNNKQALSAD